jgi:trans-L-3-hydroxyproline dehydratase
MTFPPAVPEESLARLSPRRVTTLDTHTAGEPLRILLAGAPIPEGDDILERRRAAAGDWDHWRRLLMYEPRGHADMYGAVIVPPVTPDALFGVLFMHNEGYSTMCGHAVIALARLAVELGWTPAVEPVTQVKIDTPAGLVTACARVSGGRVTSTYFENVASFAPLLDQVVEVEGLGSVGFDLGFGGAFYAYVDAGRLGLELTTANARAVIEAGMAIKHAVMAGFDIRHPVEPDLGFLYGTIFTGQAAGEGAHSRHACVFADGALDRSPTGTGVAGRVAILHARGELDAGREIRIESITGESFQGRVARTLDYHGLAAVIPEVEGMAYVTGRHDFLLEDGDPLAEGVFIR